VFQANYGLPCTVLASTDRDKAVVRTVLSFGIFGNFRERITSLLPVNGLSQLEIPASAAYSVFVEDQAWPGVR